MLALALLSPFAQVQEGTGMARTIDPLNLDAEDVKYLLTRPWLIEEYERQGLREEMAAVRDGQPTKDDPTDVTRVSTGDLSLGNIPPQIDAVRPNGVTDEDGLDDDYESWTKEDLVAEIDARNAEDGRETKLPKTGSKADLVERLHADDAEG